MGYPLRLELTRLGLLVELASYYTTRDVPRKEGRNDESIKSAGDNVQFWNEETTKMIKFHQSSI